MESTTRTAKYHPWQSPLFAFFSPSFYADVAENWRGTGTLYLFIMCVVVSFISVLPLLITCMMAARTTELSSVFKQFPTVTYNNQQISIDKPSPYQIRQAGSNDVLIEFRANDTGVPTFKAEGPKVVITKDVVAIRPIDADSDAKVFQFSELKALGNFTFTGQDLDMGWKKLMFWLPVVTYLVGMPFIFSWHFLQILIYGGICLLIGSTMEKSLEFATGMRLAAIAITPNMVLASIFTLAGNFLGIDQRIRLVLIFVWGAASVIVALVYLFIAVKAVKGTQAAPPPAPLAS